MTSNQSQPEKKDLPAKQVASAAAEEKAQESLKADVNMETQASSEKSTSSTQSTGSAKSTSSDKITKSTQSNSAASPRSQTQQKTPISKTAVVALILSLIAGGGLAGGYYYATNTIEQLKVQLTEQQKSSQQALRGQLHQANKQALEQTKTALQTALNEQLNEMDDSVQQRLTKQDSKIADVSSQIAPQDWLLEEAEYLLRIAGRTLWLEKNTQTTVALLEDADNRLAQLNQPALIPVRQAIRQDIEKVNALPKLQLEEITLSLMALEQQAATLKLASVELPEVEKSPADEELSEDIADWRANLKKSWDKAVAKLFTIRRRSGDVEPLMTPQQQQNLHFNLGLKLQQAQWAVSRQNTELYNQSLHTVTLWLENYYDAQAQEVQHFATRISELKALRVEVEYPNQLLGLDVLRDFLSDKPQQEKPPIPVNLPELLPENDQATDEPIEESGEQL